MQRTPTDTGTNTAGRIRGISGISQHRPRRLLHGDISGKRNRHTARRRIRTHRQMLANQRRDNPIRSVKRPAHPVIERRTCLPDCNQCTIPLNKRRQPRSPPPIKPIQLRTTIEGIIAAVLRASELLAGKHKRQAGRCEYQSGGNGIGREDILHIAGRVVIRMGGIVAHRQAQFVPQRQIIMS